MNQGRRVKARWVPDVVEIDRGNGITELMMADRQEPVQQLNTEPIPTIQYFQWDRPAPPKKNKEWVVNVSTAACVLGAASCFGIFLFPTLATVTLLISLGWLGFVAFANWR